MSKESRSQTMSRTLEGFIHEFGERAHRFAYRLSGNHEEAKELVQEALYRMARSWKRRDGSRRLEGWFFTILRNAFLDSRKRFDRRNAVSLDSPLGDGNGQTYGDIIPDRRQNVVGHLERGETARLVRGALGHLSEKHLAVVRLCDMDGMNYGEVARNLGLPVGTVRSRLCRARQTLRNRSPELATVAY